MALKLYAHPFSSYCQKALIALYENNIDFELCLVSPDNGKVSEEHATLWPVKRMPILVDDDRTVLEASIIIEYLSACYPGPVELIPQNPRAALDVRMLDRVFDNYVMTPMQKLVFDVIRAPEQRDPAGVADAKNLLDISYRWLDGWMKGRQWAANNNFSLADCAAAPSLLYADWAHPIDPSLTNLRAYRKRLLERPSFARAVNEARPYRPYFPLGAPDRD
jgi:glutathione S-transferase